MERKIKRYFDGRETKDGAGVKLRRTFAARDIPQFDPFLMMDFFDSNDPKDYVKGFPWHPHRGIETITYIIHGEVEHGDSLGNKGVIRDGDCQWMNAGSGILHQEMPRESEKMLGVQVWLNLPAKDKMSSPQYGEITKEMVPVFEGDNYRLHIISGEFMGAEGPMRLREETNAFFFDVELDANSEFIYQLERELTAYAFLIQGEANFDVDKENFITYPMGVLYEDGDGIKITTRNETARFLLLTGKKLNEPVAWGGPIVMNTQEELDLAFKELDEGNFIKEKAK